MDKPEKISEKDTKEIMTNVLDALRPILSKISDEKIPKRIPKKDLKDIQHSLNWLSEMGQVKEEIDLQTLPKDFKTEKQIQIFDTILGGILGVETENPTQDMLEQWDPKIMYSDLLKSKSKGNQFQKQIHAIYYEMGKLNRIPQFEEFQQSLGVDTFVSHTQSAERVNKHIKYVLRDRKQFSKSTLARHIDIFKEVVIYLETLIILLYGMNLIIKNKYLSFKEIRNKKSIGSIIHELKNIELFSPIIKIYDTHIRNSIQHGTYQIDSSEKKIELEDRKHLKTMPFSDFIIYVQTLTKQTLMISKIEYEYTYFKFVEYQKYRKSIMKN